MGELYPLKLIPHTKDYLWGGTLLQQLFKKGLDQAVVAESWELSCYKGGECYIANGALAGKKLSEGIQYQSESDLNTSKHIEELPILVKLIDAKKNLSVQVHPSDETAIQTTGERGKAEMWYVVDCTPQAYIYYGFSRKLTKEEFVLKATDGSICDALNKIHIKKGDIFYILPGTVHAIGEGSLIAEIQQVSDTTFRIYDYGRLDKNGKPRQLHLERACEVISYEPIIPSEIKVNTQAYFASFSFFEMFTCRYFKAYRVDISDRLELTNNCETFHHLLFISGQGKIIFKNERYNFEAGDSYLIPAKLGKYEISGTCRTLLSMQ